jgi:diguanylate cyclase (GGDEF)-like protein
MSVAYEIGARRDSFAAAGLATAATPAVLADATAAAPGRLLDSLAALTHQRDIDALDVSLALSLAELTSARAVSLCKRAAESGHLLERIVRCAADAHGHGGFAISSGVPDPADPLHAPLYACMDGQHVGSDVDAGGLHRLFVPILHEGRALGALQLEADAPLHGAQALAEGFARIYANYLTLLNESERDKLTGLYNRRTFERHLQRRFGGTPGDGTVDDLHLERRTAAASASAVWLAIFDIDHFKRVNDTYGHIYGDEVILLLAQQMRTCFRQGDVLFRFGGEEFVVLLSGTDEADVRAVLERFRARVAAHVFPQVGHVTVSVGYTRANEHDYPEAAVDRADKALYFAKQHGRNRAHGYEELVAIGALEPAAVTTGSIDLF